MSLFGSFAGAIGNSPSQGVSDINAPLVTRIRSQAQADHDQQMNIRLTAKDAAIAGLKAQCNALKEVVHQINPNHPLFQKTGRKLKDGDPETNLSALWIREFDAYMSKRIGGNPSQFRGM